MSTLADVATAVNTLPALVSGHDGRVLLVGHSAGGHLVLWAAAVRPPTGLAGTLALAPVADLALAQERDLGSGAVQAFLGTDVAGDEIDHVRLAPPVTPTTIVHGDADDVVPVDLARSYAAAHPRTRLVEVAGADHFAVIDPASAAWAVVVAELSRFTSPTPS